MKYQSSNNILVSVIMPTYKRLPKVWRKAVDSVMQQTYANIELIIVDDNHPESDYRSLNKNYIEKEYSGKVIYIENETNLGGSLARNQGIKLASGKYIAFLDDDDEFLANKVVSQLDFMLINDLDASFSDMLIFSNDKLVDIRNFNDIKAFDSDSLLRYHVTRQITGTPSFMIKTEIVKKVNGFDDALMGQEFFLMLKIICSSAKIGYYTKCTIKVNRSKDSISFSKSKIDGEQKIYETKCSYFDKLSRKEKAYVDFRHYVICSVAYYRLKKYEKVIPNFTKAVFCSPLSAFCEVNKMIRKRIMLLKERSKYD